MVRSKGSLLSQTKQLLAENIFVGFEVPENKIFYAALAQRYIFIYLHRFC
jgi:hypothetical protein